jgi:hypothetical protein
MKNDCNVCDGWGFIAVGTHMWILGEEIIEEDKWEKCSICKGENDGDNSCLAMSKNR